MVAPPIALALQFIVDSKSLRKVNFLYHHDALKAWNFEKNHARKTSQRGFKLTSLAHHGKQCKAYGHFGQLNHGWLNQCQIRRGIQIRAQNWGTRQRKAGKCRKLLKSHKIACRKKPCGKIPSAPITIWKNIKKGNFWCLVDVPKPASVLVMALVKTV